MKYFISALLLLFIPFSLPAYASHPVSHCEGNGLEDPSFRNVKKWVKTNTILLDALDKKTASAVCDAIPGQYKKKPGVVENENIGNHIASCLEGFVMGVFNDIKGLFTSIWSVMKLAYKITVKFPGEIGKKILSFLKAAYYGTIPTFWAELKSQGSKFLKDIGNALAAIPKGILDAGKKELVEWKCLNNAGRTNYVCKTIGYVGTEVVIGILTGGALKAFAAGKYIKPIEKILGTEHRVVRSMKIAAKVAARAVVVKKLAEPGNKYFGALEGKMATAMNSFKKSIRFKKFAPEQQDLLIAKMHKIHLENNFKNLTSAQKKEWLRKNYPDVHESIDPDKFVMLQKKRDLVDLRNELKEMGVPEDVARVHVRNLADTGVLGEVYEPPAFVKIFHANLDDQIVKNAIPKDVADAMTEYAGLLEKKNKIMSASGPTLSRDLKEVNAEMKGFVAENPRVSQYTEGLEKNFRELKSAGLSIEKEADEAVRLAAVAVKEKELVSEAAASQAKKTAAAADAQKTASTTYRKEFPDYSVIKKQGGGDFKRTVELAEEHAVPVRPEMVGEFVSDFDRYHHSGASLGDKEAAAKHFLSLMEKTDKAALKSDRKSFNTFVEMLEDPNLFPGKITEVMDHTFDYKSLHITPDDVNALRKASHGSDAIDGLVKKFEKLPTLTPQSTVTYYVKKYTSESVSEDIRSVTARSGSITEQKNALKKLAESYDRDYRTEIPNVRNKLADEVLKKELNAIPEERFKWAQAEVEKAQQQLSRTYHEVGERTKSITTKASEEMINHEIADYSNYVRKNVLERSPHATEGEIQAKLRPVHTEFRDELATLLRDAKQLREDVARNPGLLKENFENVNLLVKEGMPTSYLDDRIQTLEKAIAGLNAKIGK